MVTLLAKHAGKVMVEEDNLRVASVKCKYRLGGSWPRKTPPRRCSQVWGELISQQLPFKIVVELSLEMVQ